MPCIACMVQKKMHKEQNVQVSDTTEDDSSNAAR